MAHAGVRREWSLPEGASMREWERLVKMAATHGLITSWDDGRGRDPWYTARRCKAERTLYLACCRAVGADATEVDL